MEAVEEADRDVIMPERRIDATAAAAATEEVAVEETKLAPHEDVTIPREEAESAIAADGVEVEEAEVLAEEKEVAEEAVPDLAPEEDEAAEVEEEEAAKRGKSKNPPRQRNWMPPWTNTG